MSLTSSIHLLWPSIYWPFSASVLHTLKFWLVLVNIRVYTYAIYLLLKRDELQISEVKRSISWKENPALHLSKNWHLETDYFQNFLLQIIHKSSFWFHTGSLLCFQLLLPIFMLAIFVCEIPLLKPCTNNACVPQNWEKYKTNQKKKIQQVKLVRNSREWRRAAWIPSWQLLLVINTERKFAMWRKGWILSVGTREGPSDRETEMFF